MILDGAIASGVISKIINDLTDISKPKIKKAVEDKKNKHKSLESQIYNIIVSVLKEMNDNSYEKNSDKIYDAAEKLLIGFQKYGREDENAVRYALKDILSCVDDGKCMEFKTLLIHEISKDEYNGLYREIRMRQEEKEYRKTDGIEQKVDNLDRKLDDISNKEVRIIENEDKNIKFQNNKKQDYIDNWNSRLFLHVDNDERPLTLADAFIMPFYAYHFKDRSIKFTDNDTMNEVIEKFIKHNRSANMLITGVPGIGKTSIVSWIANEFKENDDIIILRFRDWERDELGNGIFAAIRRTLDCLKSDLENKIIILDGFDEIKALDNGNILISNFLNEMLDFKNVKVIVTSRTDYIDDFLFQYICNLLPFGINEIKRFYNIITGNELKNDLDHSNLDVFGIPVILYMAIMSEIDITKEATKPELYGKIFAEKGGIFDRFSYGGDGYDYGNQILRDSKNIRSYLKFLQEIAFKMFDEDKLSIPRKEDEIPNLTFQGAEISVLEFPIKHLFDNTATNIEFVHKSIYEYFVSEYIIQQIKNVIYSDDFKQKLASFFGKTFVHRILSVEIIDFLKYKISNCDLMRVYDRVIKAFQLMMENGMTSYTHICYNNVIDCEMRIFANMLEIIHLWKNTSPQLADKLIGYIKYNRNQKLNLCEMVLKKSDLRRSELAYANLEKAYLSLSDLRNSNLREVNLNGAHLNNADLRKSDLTLAELVEADLRGVDFRFVYLVRANLRQADLRKANLKETDLNGAYLEGADLRGADLTGTCLRGAKLGDAIFDENQVQYLRREYNLEGTRVFIKESNEIITYKKYSKRKYFYK